MTPSESTKTKAKEQTEKYEWIHPDGIKILCDFGQCENGSLLKCNDCGAYICLDHSEKHKQSCGKFDNVYVKMMFEQEFLDHKKWEEP